MSKKDYLDKIANLPKNDKIGLVLCGFMDTKFAQDIDYAEIAQEGASIGEKAQVIAITADEIREYVRETNSLGPVVIEKEPNTIDGVYIIDNNGVFDSYIQSRGIKDQKRTFDSYQEAINALAEDAIRSYEMILKNN